MFLNQSLILEYSIMKNEVFFSTCESLQTVGAYTALRSDVSRHLISEIDLGRFENISADQGVIIVGDFLCSSLDTDELEAIIAHEQGHISLGHLDMTKSVKHGGYIKDMSVELEADAFAASVVGADVVIKGIKKALKVCLGFMFAGHPGGQERIDEAYETVTEKMKPRFDALCAAT